MNKNNFDQPIDRENSASVKWGLREKIFGSKDVLPMWVADMDFPSAPAIIAALEKRVRHGIFGYVDLPPSFFQTIRSWLARRFAWQVQED